MEKTVKGLEKVVITKEAKALLPIVNKEHRNPWARGLLIKDNSILATDTKIIARILLNTEIPKENIPANVQTGADTERIWISFESMKKALANIPRKTSLPEIQNNVFVHKSNGSMTLQIVDEGLNTVSFEERGNNESLATTFPETDFLLNPEEKDVAKQTIIISAEIFLKIADMVKSLGKDTKITIQTTDYRYPALFKIKDRNVVKADGAFMLLKPEEEK